MSNNGDKWSSPTPAKLEADIAYFDARLALLRDGPASSYQEAQIKAYRELEALLTDRLLRLSGQGGAALPDHYPGRIEVEEILGGETTGDGETESE
ncbi:MAG: hypothetical protein KDI74_07520 [Gammaproteobacteria bacterium]|nr:hypothetical protein [Gammaproteobacteria bacterium]HXK55904.1 hypothetical protein [Gammaproteobacteria bacterium]